MASVLLELGVFVLAPERRLAIAKALLEHGAAEGDVRMLASFLRESEPDEAKSRRYLATVLSDSARMRQGFVDLAEFRSAQRREEQRAARPFGDQPYRPGPGDEPRDVWEHDRMCQIATCRVDGDRRTIQEVARELDVSETTLGVMLARGRVLRSSPETKAKPALGLVTSDDEAKARRQEMRSLDEFRQRMRDDGKRASAKRPAGYVDFNRIRRHMDEIVDVARATGRVDLAACCRDKARMGALATLEADGQILRNGPADYLQLQPYRVARNDQERKRFRELFRAWNQGAQRRPVQEVAHTDREEQRA